jgi:GxxExxY protein
MTENEISRMILDCAICVHRELGPGLLESVYEIAMAYELQQRGLRVARQVPVTIRYKEISFDAAFRADLLVGKRDRGAEVR